MAKKTTAKTTEDILAAQIKKYMAISQREEADVEDIKSILESEG